MAQGRTLQEQFVESRDQVLQQHADFVAKYQAALADFNRDDLDISHYVTLLKNIQTDFSTVAAVSFQLELNQNYRSISYTEQLLQLHSLNEQRQQIQKQYLALSLTKMLAYFHQVKEEAIPTFIDRAKRKLTVATVARLQDEFDKVYAPVATLAVILKPQDNQEYMKLCAETRELLAEISALRMHVWQHYAQEQFEKSQLGIDQAEEEEQQENNQLTIASREELETKLTSHIGECEKMWDFFMCGAARRKLQEIQVLQKGFNAHYAEILNAGKDGLAADYVDFIKAYNAVDSALSAIRYRMRKLNLEMELALRVATYEQAWAQLKQEETLTLAAVEKLQAEFCDRNASTWQLAQKQLSNHYAGLAAAYNDINHTRLWLLKKRTLELNADIDRIKSTLTAKEAEQKRSIRLHYTLLFTGSALLTSIFAGASYLFYTFGLANIAALPTSHILAILKPAAIFVAGLPPLATMAVSGLTVLTAGAVLALSLIGINKLVGMAVNKVGLKNFSLFSLVLGLSLAAGAGLVLENGITLLAGLPLTNPIFIILAKAATFTGLLSPVLAIALASVSIAALSFVVISAVSGLLHKANKLKEMLTPAAMEQASPANRAKAQRVVDAAILSSLQPSPASKTPSPATSRILRPAEPVPVFIPAASTIFDPNEEMIFASSRRGSTRTRRGASRALLFTPAPSTPTISISATPTAPTLTPTPTPTPTRKRCSTKRARQHATNSLQATQEAYQSNFQP